MTPGSSCIANAYTSNHGLLASKDIGFFRRTGLHLVDTGSNGARHASSNQALLLPIRTLVFSGTEVVLLWPLIT